jgi:hypothetical protein
MGGKRLCILAVLMPFWLGSPAASLFAQTQGADAALSGLTTLHPVIRYVEEGILRPSDPAARQLQSDVERLLADAGINIVDAAEFDRLLGARSFPVAMLEMDVRMSKHPELDSKNYLLSLHIKQAVFLTRKPVVRFLATTWESTNFGVAKDPAFVRGVARESMGRFIQEWSTQNTE